MWAAYEKEGVKPKQDWREADATGTMQRCVRGGLVRIRMRKVREAELRAQEVEQYCKRCKELFTGDGCPDGHRPVFYISFEEARRGGFIKDTEESGSASLRTRTPTTAPVVDEGMVEVKFGAEDQGPLGIEFKEVSIKSCNPGGMGQFRAGRPLEAGMILRAINGVPADRLAFNA